MEEKMPRHVGWPCHVGIFPLLTMKPEPEDAQLASPGAPSWCRASKSGCLQAVRPESLQPERLHLKAAAVRVG